MSVRQGNKLIAGATQGAPCLFDIKWADHILDNTSWLRADTFSWQSGAVYMAAYRHLVNDLGEKETYYFWVNSGHEDRHCYTKSRTPSVGDTIYYDLTDLTQTGTVTAYNSSDDSVSFSYNGYNWSAVYDSTITDAETETIAGTTIAYYLADDGHKIVLADQESAVQEIYNATGIAWYYILDTENQRFKLPRTKFGFTGIRSGVGNFVPAGLPDHYHNVRYRRNDNSGYHADGSVSPHIYTGSNLRGSYPSLNASESNSIYGNSDTVQPKATEMYLYFYVGNFTQTALENTAGVTTEVLNTKVTIGHEVVEFQEPTAVNNYTWYRKYRDGWVEQGGISSANTDSFNVFVTLPITMADGNYTICVNATSSSAYSSNSNNATINRATFMSGATNRRSATGFYWCVLTGNFSNLWRVEGMAAS